MDLRVWSIFLFSFDDHGWRIYFRSRFYGNEESGLMNSVDLWQQCSCWFVDNNNHNNNNRVYERKCRRWGVHHVHGVNPLRRFRADLSSQTMISGLEACLVRGLHEVRVPTASQLWTMSSQSPIVAAAARMRPEDVEWIRVVERIYYDFFCEKKTSP